MKNDAREAALGLLGLSSHVDLRMLSSSIVPLKRKSSVVFSEPVRERPPPHEATKVVRERETAKEVKEPNLKGKEREKERDVKEELTVKAARETKGMRRKGKGREVVDVVSSDDPTSDSIRCLCEIPDDDGLSMACDECGRWVHSACFDVLSQENVPEEWSCWVCKPRPVDKEKAVKIQQDRQKAIRMQEARNARAAQADAHDPQLQQRKVSPGVEKKPRRAIDGGNGHAKRKRRASVTTHHLQTNEDEQIDIDEPSSANDYTHIDTDIIPHQRTRDKLKRMARGWRGITALDTPSPTTPVVLPPDVVPGPSSQTTLRPLPASSFNNPALSPNTNPSVRPPAFAMHTTQSISSDSYIAPFTSTVLPSALYLSDPLNMYAHLSIPKPFVHLVGPPLDVALDARLTGREARYVRNGCRPNAVLRPVLCPKNKGKGKRPSTAEDVSEEEDAAESLSFAVFALRDLKANEEVVLGWEWDDGSVIHYLPALIDSPHLFAPLRFQQFRNQMTSMLHALSSTFTTCACGTKARDCALSRLAEFVDSSAGVPIPLTPSSSTFLPPSLPHDSCSTRGTDQARDAGGVVEKVDLGPLVGRERGFRTREKVPMSGGMNGVEMVTPTSTTWPEVEAEAGSSTSGDERRTSGTKRRKKSKERVTENDMAIDDNPRSRRRTDSNQPPCPIESTPVPNADMHVPPRLRKRWIREKAQALRRSPSPLPMEVDKGREGIVKEVEKSVEENRGDDVVDNDVLAMPPPPLPPSVLAVSSVPAAPALPSAFLAPNDSARFAEVPISPTTRFANLSLLSPAVQAGSSYFPTPTPSPLPPAASSTSAVNGIAFSPPAESHSHPSSESPLTDDSMQVDEAQQTQSQDYQSVLGEPFQRRSSPRPIQTSPTSPALPAASVSTPPPSASDPLPPAPTPPLDGVLSPSSLANAPPATPDVSTTSASTVGRPCTTPRLPWFVPPPGASPFTIRAFEELQESYDRLHEACDRAKSRIRGEPCELPILPEPTPAPAPPPPPPPKKKISMGDYLSRKRGVESKAASVSPAVGTVPLAKESSPEAKAASPDPMPIPASPDLSAPMPRSSEDHSPLINDHATADHSLHDDTQSALPPASETKSTSPSPTNDVTDVDPAEGYTDGSSPQLPTPLPAPPNPEQIVSGSQVPMDEDVDTTHHVHDQEYTLVNEKTLDVPQHIETVDIPPPPTPPPPPPPPPPPSLAKGSMGGRPAQRPHETKLSIAQPAPTHHAITLSRQQSQEDGEILSPPPPKPPPLAPRSHTPPTHPRSFHTHSGTASPVPQPASRRFLLPSASAYAIRRPSPSINSRPLPNAPRALRAISHSSHLSPPLYSASTPSRPLGPPSHTTPRGPSADRNRDWDRDRGNSWSGSRDRVRSGSGSGWSR